MPKAADCRYSQFNPSLLNRLFRLSARVEQSLGGLQQILSDGPHSRVVPLVVWDRLKEHLDEHMHAQLASLCSTPRCTSEFSDGRIYSALARSFQLCLPFRRYESGQRVVP